MGKTSKSPTSVLLVDYRVGQNRLRPYAHRFSPQKFTQPQLFACLVLKHSLPLDDRKLSALPEDAQGGEGMYRDYEYREFGRRLR